MAKKKWITRVASVGAAVLLTAGLNAPAFAETKDNDVKTVSNNDGAKIEKTLTMAKDGVSVPDAEFTFTFTPCANQLDDASKGVTAGPSHNNVTIKSGTDGAITTANDSAKSNNLFVASDFKELGPGIYGYIVKEEQSGYTAPAGDTENHVMTYSKKNYYVEVKVENKEGKLAITGVTAQEATLDDTGKVIQLGEKIEGTNESHSDAQDGIPFENTYTEYANDDGEGANPDKGLVISKTTKGTAFKTDQEFTYKIEFKADDANRGLTTSVTNGVTVYSDEGCTTEATLSDNGIYYFKLQKGGEIDFKLPAGTKYTVEEINNGGATSTTVEYVENGEAKAATTSGAEVTNALAGENANTVTFTNTKESNPLTGIINEYGAAIAVVAIAGAGLVTLTIRRKRNAA